VAYQHHAQHGDGSDGLSSLGNHDGGAYEQAEGLAHRTHQHDREPVCKEGSRCQPQTCHEVHSAVPAEPDSASPGCSTVLTIATTLVRKMYTAYPTKACAVRAWKSSPVIDVWETEIIQQSLVQYMLESVLGE
jgi:hypothetical protein